VRRTGLSEAQKRDLAIYDNRTGELADWNVDQLVKDAEEGLDLSPFFFENELEDILKSVETPIAPDEFGAVDESIPTEHHCPKCGYEWSGGS
jgi:hypothetical protein